MLKIQLFRLRTNNGYTFIGQQVLNARDAGSVPRNNAALLKFLENHHCNIEETTYEVVEELRYCLTNKTIAHQKEMALRKETNNTISGKPAARKPEVVEVVRNEPPAVVDDNTAAVIALPAEVYVVDEQPTVSEEKQPEKQTPAKKSGEEGELDKSGRFYKGKLKEARDTVQKLIAQGLPVTRENFNANRPLGRGRIIWGERPYALEAIKDVCAELGVEVVMEE